MLYIPHVLDPLTRKHTKLAKREYVLIILARHLLARLIQTDVIGLRSIKGGLQLNLHECRLVFMEINNIDFVTLRCR